jgi:hypothetical protein
MKIEDIMKQHLICSREEAEQAINFVMELLEEDIKRTKKNEPYATISIAQMEKARQMVYDLNNLLEGGDPEPEPKPLKFRVKSEILVKIKHSAVYNITPEDDESDEDTVNRAKERLESVYHAQIVPALEKLEEVNTFDEWEVVDRKTSAVVKKEEND